MQLENIKNNFQTFLCELHCSKSKIFTMKHEMDIKYLHSKLNRIMEPLKKSQKVTFIARKISKSHFGCEAITCLRYIWHRNPNEKISKSHFYVKKTQNVMLYINYIKGPSEKNLKKSLLLQEKSQKVTFISCGTCLQYVCSI